MKKFTEWVKNRDIQLQEKELTTKARKKLPEKSFALPKKNGYPIHDKSHAQNALARVTQHGSSSEKAKVRKSVCKKHPDFETCNGKD